MPETVGKSQGGEAFRITWPAYIALSILIALVAALPVLAAMAAGTVASLNGCVLNEGGVNPCVIWGVDFGNALYSLGVLGWLDIVTLPLGILALVAWTVAFAVIALRARAIDRRKGIGAKGNGA